MPIAPWIFGLPHTFIPSPFFFFWLGHPPPYGFCKIWLGTLFVVGSSPSHHSRDRAGRLGQGRDGSDPDRAGSSPPAHPHPTPHTPLPVCYSPFLGQDCLCCVPPPSQGRDMNLFPCLALPFWRGVGFPSQPSLWLLQALFLHVLSPLSQLCFAHHPFYPTPKTKEGQAQGTRTGTGAASLCARCALGVILLPFLTRRMPRVCPAFGH